MIETKRYARIPYVVEAVEVTALNYEDVAEWCGGQVKVKNRPLHVDLIVPNVQGNQIARCDARVKDHTIRGINARLTEYEEDITNTFMVTWGDFVVKEGNRFSVTSHQDMIKEFVDEDTFRSSWDWDNHVQKVIDAINDPRRGGLIR